MTAHNSEPSNRTESARSADTVRLLAAARLVINESARCYLELDMELKNAIYDLETVVLEIEQFDGEAAGD